MIHTVRLKVSRLQILRKIYFGKCELSKIAVLAILEALIFGFGEFLHFLLAQIVKYFKMANYETQNCYN